MPVTNALSSIPRAARLLSLYVERPSAVQRVEDGEIVGWVIIGVGGLGVLLAVFQGIYLLMTRCAVGAQLRNLDNPSPSNPLGRVLLAFRGDGKRIENVELAELRISEAVLREMPRLERFQSFLRLAVAAGPLLGLIGTVIGMIITFRAIVASGTSDPRLMADGIGQAMIATVLGLGIAIPLLFMNAGLVAHVAFGHAGSRRAEPGPARDQRPTPKRLRSARQGRTCDPAARVFSRRNARPCRVRVAQASRSDDRWLCSRGRPTPSGRRVSGRSFDSIWIDLLNPSADEETTLEAQLGVDIPTREEMQRFEVSGRLYREEDAIVMTATLPARTDSDDLLMAPVAFVVAGGKLVTVRYHEPRVFKTFPQRASAVQSRVRDGRNAARRAARSDRRPHDGHPRACRGRSRRDLSGDLSQRPSRRRAATS